MQIRISARPNYNSILNTIINGIPEQASQETINRYIDNDIRRTSGGSKITTLKMVDDAAADLCAMINAGAASLPESVRANVATASPSSATRSGDGSIKASISFSNSGMSRPSLQPSLYEGAQNIVVLFEKGWSAGGVVYGSWHGADVSSRQSYPGAGFIHSAVSDFNGKYASVGIRAVITGEYA